jgi:hypothetical protein
MYSAPNQADELLTEFATVLSRHYKHGTPSGVPASRIPQRPDSIDKLKFVGLKLKFVGLKTEVVGLPLTPVAS